MKRGRGRSWPAITIALAASAGCSSEPSRTELAAPPAEPTRPARADAPPPPPIAPRIPDVRPLDRDGDRVDDALAEEERALRAEIAAAPDLAARVAARARLDAPVTVEAIFGAPIGDAELEAFRRAGGVVRHVFRHVSYGFTGQLPRSAVARAVASLGPSLVLLEGDRRVEHHLDEATRTGRVRPVWRADFGGGYSGSPSIVIAIVDGGVDATHPDLAGRMAGWKDYTSEASPTPLDVEGHGTHVAGIAVGSGAAFGVGPGTLRWTDSGDASKLTTDDWVENPIHLPTSIDVTSTATWTGGGPTTLSLMSNTDGATGDYATITSVTGSSPLALSFSGASAPGSRLSLALLQNAARDVGRFAIVNDVAGYPGAGDGFPALRGVAAGSSWYGAKVFPAAGTASRADIGAAMDDLVAIRVATNIKVVNMSFGIVNGGVDPTLRAKANTMVDSGMVVVASAGNNGPGVLTGDPGRAANVITVGAVNDVNALTAYTSGGLTGAGDDVDMKPDLLAPGGSAYRSRILSADSNTADASDATFADARADDYTQIHGTSMAAPFVAGAAALLVEALERSGQAWSFASSASPFQVKMLLLASSTETNRLREVGSGGPQLGRATTQKDRSEGYGVVNPDAAIEAATITWDYQPLSASTTGLPDDRRAWGRKVVVPAGRTLKLALDVAATADFDLYVYESTPSSKGNPVLLAFGDRAGLGVDEVLTWRFLETTTLHAFVKRISGNGAFTLTGSTFTCGDGVLEPGEECDDSNDVGGDCCSVACQLEPTGSPCAGGACNAGACMPLPADAGAEVGASDAGSTDPPDAGSIADDAGSAPPDAAGASDAAAGAKDGGTLIDDPSATGVSPFEGVVAGGGCACRAERGGRAREQGVMWVLAAVATLVKRRLRRARVGHPDAG